MLVEYAFAISLLVLVVAERVLNAIALLLVRLVFGTGSDDRGLKGYAGTQLVGAGMSFVATLLSAAGSAAAGFVSALTAYAIWMAVAFVFFSALFVVQEQYASLLIGIVESWNATYGAIVYEVVFFPLQVLCFICWLVTAKDSQSHCILFCYTVSSESGACEGPKVLCLIENILLATAYIPSRIFSLQMVWTGGRQCFQSSKIFHGTF